jgi:hypothetical protein
VTLGGALLANIVAEMGAVPDYNVLILDYLVVDEFVDAELTPTQRLVAWEPAGKRLLKPLLGQLRGSYDANHFQYR